MIYFILALAFSALFAAMDQLTRHEEFHGILRLFPVGFYTWDLHLPSWIPPTNAEHTYQGLKIWLLAMGWLIAPEMSILWFLGIMVAWWLIARNLFIHVVLTSDWF